MSIAFPRTFANLILAQLSYLDDNFTAINTAIDAVSGIAGLDANSRVNKPVYFVYDGVGNRSASPTPAANVIPVTDATGKIPAGFSSPGGVTGFASANSSGTTAVVSVPMKSGDILIISNQIIFHCNTTEVASMNLGLAGGGLGFQQLNGTAGAILQSANVTSGSNYYWTMTSVVFVSGGGGPFPVALTSTLSATGPTSISNSVGLAFMLKN